MDAKYLTYKDVVVGRSDGHNHLNDVTIDIDPVRRSDIESLEGRNHLNDVTIDIDPKYLTYRDVVVRRSDVQSLEGRNYLNDTIIDFYFAYLSAWFQSNEVLMVPTSLSFLLANPYDWDIFIATVIQLDFHNKKLIFFPINSGSHWSLLLYCRNRNLFMHYDSLSMINHEFALSLAESLNTYISFDWAEFTESRAPRQSNGYDCGLYLIDIAREIYDCYINVEKVQIKTNIRGSFDVMLRVNCNYVEYNMRSELLSLLSNLKREETSANMASSATTEREEKENE